MSRGSSCAASFVSLQDVSYKHCVLSIEKLLEGLTLFAVLEICNTPMLWNANYFLYARWPPFEFNQLNFLGKSQDFWAYLEVDLELKWILLNPMAHLYSTLNQCAKASSYATSIFYNSKTSSLSCALCIGKFFSHGFPYSRSLMLASFEMLIEFYQYTRWHALN